MSKQPGAVEKGIRFGCGFMFGVVVSMVWFLWGWPAGLYSLLTVLVLPGVVGGVLALWFGDAFWEWIASHQWWRL